MWLLSVLIGGSPETIQVLVPPAESLGFHRVSLLKFISYDFKNVLIVNQKSFPISQLTARYVPTIGRGGGKRARQERGRKTAEETDVSLLAKGPPAQCISFSSPSTGVPVLLDPHSRGDWNAYRCSQESVTLWLEVRIVNCFRNRTCLETWYHFRFTQPRTRWRITLILKQVLWKLKHLVFQGF